MQQLGHAIEAIEAIDKMHNSKTNELDPEFAHQNLDYAIEKLQDVKEELDA